MHRSSFSASIHGLCPYPNKLDIHRHHHPLEQLAQIMLIASTHTEGVLQTVAQFPFFKRTYTTGKSF